MVTVIRKDYGVLSVTLVSNYTNEEIDGAELA